MDRKGQSAVIFIILIPVFLLITTIIVDTGINMYNEKKLKNVTEDVVINLLNNENLNNYDYSNKEEITEKLEDKASLIYRNNDIDTEYLRVEIVTKDRINVSNSNTYYSFINSLLNKGNGNRQTTIDVTGYKDSNGEIIIEFVGDTDED